MDLLPGVDVLPGVWLVHDCQEDLPSDCLLHSYLGGVARGHTPQVKVVADSPLLSKLEDTARYAGLLLAPAQGFGRGRGFFCPSGKKKSFFMMFWPIFGNFWCPVVTVVTFISYLSNFEKNSKKSKNFNRKSSFFFKSIKAKPKVGKNAILLVFQY